MQGDFSRYATGFRLASDHAGRSWKRERGWQLILDKKHYYTYAEHTILVLG